MSAKDSVNGFTAVIHTVSFTKRKEFILKDEVVKVIFAVVDVCTFLCVLVCLCVYIAGYGLGRMTEDLLGN